MPESRDSPMRLELDAVRWSMDAHHVPIDRQLRVWKLVRLLHDVRWHRQRTVHLYCQAHAWDTSSDVAWDFRCKRCRMSLGVDDADL